MRHYPCAFMFFFVMIFQSCKNNTQPEVVLYEDENQNQTLSSQSPNEEEKVFQGGAFLMDYFPAFDQFFLSQILDDLPQRFSVKIEKKIVKLTKDHRFSHDKGKQYFGGNYFSDLEQKGMLAYHAKSYAYFRDKLYILKKTVVKAHSEKNKEEDFECRPLIEIWTPGATDPKFCHRPEFDNVLRSFGSVDDLEKKVGTFSAEEKKALSQVVYDKRSKLRTVGDYLHYEHTILKENTLFSEVFLIDEELKVQTSRLFPIEKREPLVAVVAGKIAGESAIVRAHIQMKHQTEGSLESPTAVGPVDESRLISNIRFYTWFPKKSDPAIPTSRKPESSIEIPRHVEGLNMIFDEKSKKFYLAGTWHWRTYRQTLGFLMALDDQLKPEWTRTFSLDKDTSVRGMWVDKDGSITLAGGCGSSRADTRSVLTFQDLFLARFCRLGQFLEGVSFGTNRNDMPKHVSVAADGGFMIAGSFDGPITHTADHDKTLGFQFPLALFLPYGPNVMDRFESRVHVRSVKGGEDLKLKRIFKASDLALLKDAFQPNEPPLFIKNTEAKALHQNIWEKLKVAYKTKELKEYALAIEAIAEKYKQYIPSCEFDLNFMEECRKKHPKRVHVLNLYRDFDGVVVSRGVQSFELGTPESEP
jgi:hypothetical protein